MSKDWKVTSSSERELGITKLASDFLGAISGGSSNTPVSRTYEVTNKSGEVRHVTATSRDKVGEKISRGDFDKSKK